MKKSNLFFLLINLAALLIYFNYAVSQKEDILKNGELVLLELAPVDPRSLMQGDYMILNYNLSDNLRRSEEEQRGYCVVRLDSNNVAQLIRLQQDITPLEAGEKLIKYTSPNGWSTNIGAESYFFQEGQGEKFANAKYGGVKIDKSGNSLLVGLYDENRKLIK